MASLLRFFRHATLQLVLIGFSCVSVSALASEEQASDFAMTVVAGEKIKNANAIQRFYAGRNGTLLWVNTQETPARLSDSAKDVIALISDSWKHGLNPDNYHIQPLNVLLKDGIPEGQAVASETLLSDAAIQIAQDLSGMRLSPRILEEDTTSWSRGMDPDLVLQVLSEQSYPSVYLERLAPQDKIYGRLQEELESLLKDLQNHPEKEAKPPRFSRALKPGVQHPQILKIRHVLGDDTESDIYDESLQARVEAFQKKHGLTADGIVGPRSFDALFQTRTQKLVKILANLERRRWVRRPMPSRYVAVNIPQMELIAVDDNKESLRMPVIVGRIKRPTMSFVDHIIGIRFNPFWYVPDTIKSEDYLPALKKDPNALEDHAIQFRIKTPEGSKLVASTDIDWASVTESDLKNIQMFQGPGDDNALGVIRVLMPNQYDIYLHDTNAPKLFAKDDRALSSGCVRVSEPRRIANFVLGKNDDWSDDKIDTYVGKQKLIEIRAKEEIPVYIFYYTVWLDDRDDLVIANDLYGRDAKLVGLLQKYGKIPQNLENIH